MYTATFITVEGPILNFADNRNLTKLAAISFCLLAATGCNASFGPSGSLFGWEQQEGAVVVIRSETDQPISYQILEIRNTELFRRRLANNANSSTTRGFANDRVEQTSEDIFYHDAGRYVVRYQCHSAMAERSIFFDADQPLNEITLTCPSDEVNSN